MSFRTKTVLLLVVSLFSCSTPLYQSLNSPGQSIDIKSHLIPGKINIVHFYADWCPKCKKWAPTLKAIPSRFPDMVVHFINIDEFDSPVAQQYQLDYIPQFIIYDSSGYSLAQGKTAEQWLRSELNRRLGQGR